MSVQLGNGCVCMYSCFSYKVRTNGVRTFLLTWFEGWYYNYILVGVSIGFGTMHLFLMVSVLYTAWFTLHSMCRNIVIENNPPGIPVMTRQLQPSMTLDYITTHIILCYFSSHWVTQSASLAGVGICRPVSGFHTTQHSATKSQIMFKSRAYLEESVIIMTIII